jgi:hypothetical protein
MAESKAELQREVRLLRQKVEEMQGLLQQAAIKYEDLHGAYEATSATDAIVREDLRKFKLPPIPEHRQRSRTLS